MSGWDRYTYTNVSSPLNFSQKLLMNKFKYHVKYLFMMSIKLKMITSTCQFMTCAAHLDFLNNLYFFSSKREM